MHQKSSGFTLIEIVVALFVITLLVGGLIVPIQRQIEARQDTDVKTTIADVREALHAFAVTNGRLPCPATVANGPEVCAAPYDGLVPTSVLGISAIDPWGNQIRYAVHPSYTTVASVLTLWKAPPAVGLKICAVKPTVPTPCTGTNLLANLTAAVIYSTGPNKTAVGADEAENLNGDTTFVSHGRTNPGAPSGEFDDIVSWVSPYALFGKMLSAGTLP